MSIRARREVAGAVLVFGVLLVSGLAAQPPCPAPAWPVHHLELIRQPSRLHLVDLDGDGGLDIVAAGDRGHVEIAFSRGPNDGLGPGPGGLHGHELPVRVAEDLSGPEGVGSSDLDGDGAPDLVVSHQDGLTIWWSWRDGVPEAQELIPVDGASLLRIAEMTGDELDDLVVTVGRGWVHVYPNLGDRAFADPFRQTVGGGGGAVFSIDLADSDRADGLDVLVSRDFQSACVMLNDGNGQLLDSVWYPSSRQAVGVAAGDFDRRNGPDLAVVSRAEHDVRIYLNEGDGTLVEGVTLELPQAVGFDGEVRAFDLTDDGAVDLVLAEGSNLITWPGRANGTFRPPWVQGMGSAGKGLAFADLDDDGDLDLVRNDYDHRELRAYLNAGGGRLSSDQRMYSNGMMEEVWVVDLDRDDRLDVVAASLGDWTLDVHFGDGAGGFAPVVRTELDERPEHAVLVDVDGDGELDLVMTAFSDDEIVTWLGNGDGTFRTGTRHATAYRPRELASADLDGVAGPDLVIIHRELEEVNVMFNAGDGTFLPEVLLDSPIRPGQVVVGDFDGRDGPDVLVRNTFSRIYLIRNQGGGVFGDREDILAFNLEMVGAGDLDSDDDLDLVYSTWEDGVFVGTLLNDGDGGFEVGTTLQPITTRPAELVMHDLDGDGLEDVLYTYQDSVALTGIGYLLAAGAGELFPAADIPSERDTRDIAVGDFDDDGSVELVSTGWEHVGVHFECVTRPPWLLRNDSVRSLSPLDPPLATILAAGRATRLELIGPDGVPTPGTDDDDDALIEGWADGQLDPDASVLSDATRPLVFYESQRADDVILLSKSEGRVRIHRR
ncbi:MAG: VCBS repeat-containing protein [Acidobacteriota bacterium]